MTAQTGELPLAGLRTVVTGASSGIGRAIAIAFAAAGARVGIGFWHSSEPARALADELGPGHPLLQADLSTPDGCTSIVRAALVMTLPSPSMTSRLSARFRPTRTRPAWRWS